MSLAEYPHLAAWVTKIRERQPVDEGLDVPEANPMKDAWSDPEKMKALLAEGQSKLASNADGS